MAAARLVRIDTGWACGGLFVQGDTVVGGAPIFKRFVGQSLAKLSRTYKVEEMIAPTRSMRAADEKDSLPATPSAGSTVGAVFGGAELEPSLPEPDAHGPRRR